MTQKPPTSVDMYIDIYYGNHISTITNKSKMYLYVSILPVKPKRNPTLIYVVPPNSFLTLEENLDVELLSFSYKQLRKD